MPDDEAHEVHELAIKVATISADVAWLKAAFWVIAAAMVGLVFAQFQ